MTYQSLKKNVVEECRYILRLRWYGFTTMPFHMYVYVTLLTHDRLLVPIAVYTVSHLLLMPFDHLPWSQNWSPKVALMLRDSLQKGRSLRTKVFGRGQRYALSSRASVAQFLTRAPLRHPLWNYSYIAFISLEVIVNYLGAGAKIIKWLSFQIIKRRNIAPL